MSDFFPSGCLIDDMHPLSDADLIREYAAVSAEEAFRELVSRHNDGQLRHCFSSKKVWPIQLLKRINDVRMPSSVLMVAETLSAERSLGKFWARCGHGASS